MPTVWVANWAGHHYEKVRELLKDKELEIKALTLDDQNPLEVDRLQWHLARGIVKWCREDDYLLISGSPFINAAAYVLWILQFGKCNIVQWNAKLKRYELRVVERDNLGRILEQQLIR